VGYIRHHAIVVTGYADALDKLERVRKEAVRLCEAVSGIVASQRNGYASFFIAPDGSKEGWGASADAEIHRDQFLRYLQATAPELIWIEVQYGDERGENLVTRDSSMPSRVALRLEGVAARGGREDRPDRFGEK
jgi:hypothetical protein